MDAKDVTLVEKMLSEKVNTLTQGESGVQEGRYNAWSGQEVGAHASL